MSDRMGNTERYDAMEVTAATITSLMVERDDLRKTIADATRGREEIDSLRERLRGAVEDLEALRAVLSPYSGFESHGARIQRAREMVTDLLADLGGK